MAKKNNNRDKEKNKQKLEEKFGNVTLDILECIASIPEALVGAFVSRNDAYRQYGIFG